MEEEERPRKIQKLDHDETSDHHSQEENGPLMAGAINSSETAAAEGASDEANNQAETDEAGDSNKAIRKDGENAPREMSKTQMKKLLRQQKWEEQKEQRRIWRKEKDKARKERKRAAAQEAARQRQEAGDEDSKAPTTTRERKVRSVLVPITLVIDCAFDDLMIDKERISLGSQVTRSYSDNSRAPYRSHLAISSFDKLLKERFDTVLAKTHEHWKGVHIMQEDFVHAAELAKDWMNGPQGGKLEGAFADKTDAKPEDGEIVYLTSDSPYTLTELKPYSTYIIGGLVDKNRHKGICYKRATEQGVKTAKLPIGEYLQMASRSVLATNHVVEIMLKWLELKDWGEAFMQVMPKRKGGILKQNTGQSGEGRDGDGQDSDDADGQDGEEQDANGPHAGQDADDATDRTETPADEQGPADVNASESQDS
jgi:tRNA (guanine9-N1)-methyltransferase